MIRDWIDVSKLFKYLLTLFIGMCFIVYGFATLTIDAFNMNKMTDDEVIKRAKELGMVELRQIYNDKKQ